MIDASTLMWLCYDMPHLPLSAARDLPELPGVYVVYQDDTVLYVGQAQNLKQRWMAHHRRYQLLIAGNDVHVAWCVLPESDEHTRILYEQSLITTFHPRFNSTRFFPQAMSRRESARPMSNYLKALREARGFSRYAFARAMGVDPATVWRWEQSAALPSDTLKDLARVLNVAAIDIDPELGITRTQSLI